MRWPGLLAVVLLVGCGDDDAGSVDGAAGDAAVVSDGGAGWAPLPPLPGGPRQETSVVAVGRRIYVIGGFDETGAVVADVEAFDVDSGMWLGRKPLPEAMHHTNAAAVGGKIYVLGGLRTLAFTPVGRGYVYDPGGDEWTPVAAMPAGSERGAAMTAPLGAKIILAGGFRGTAVKDVSAYDTGSNMWEPLPELPETTDHGVGAVVDGRFYAIGGRSGAITSHRPRVDAYDPTLRIWLPRMAMPTSRGGAAAAALGGRIIVAGGEGNSAAGSGVFAVVEAYDVASNMWMSLAPMRTPRHGTGAAVIDGKFYMPGGADRQAFAATATVEVFTP